MRRSWFISLLFSLSASANASAECQQDFKTFIAQFELSESFQTAHTHLPLQYSFAENVEPEPRVVDKIFVSAADTGFPGVRYPSRRTQKAVPFQRREDRLS